MTEKLNHKVVFSGNLTAQSFERVIKQLSKETSIRGLDQLSISLKSVSWCDPYALCLVILWMHYLKNKGINIHVALPKISANNVDEPSPDSGSSEVRAVSGSDSDNRSVQKDTREDIALFSFLFQSRFIEILDDLDITHDSLEAPLKRQPKQIHSLISPFLQFAKWSNLNSFLSGLQSSSQFDLFFKEASQFDVVRNGKIRDVILRELGDNIFEHASGEFGLLVMNKNAVRRYATPPWEEPFFRTLGVREYLEVVISDRGPGIPKTIQRAYYQDDSIKKPAKPTNADLLEYAFLQYTTKKKPEERLKRLLDVLKGTDQLDVIPTTGLYWVKETCREFNALLTIRSRDSILVYDFLNHPDLVRPRRIETIEIRRKQQKLQDFPGVQIKLCFPLTDVRREKQTSPTFQNTVTKIRPHRLIILAPFFKGANPNDINTQAQPVLNVLSEVQRIKLESNDPKIIVIDFEDTRLSNKTLFIFGIELMRMQDPENTLIAINANNLNMLFSEFAEFCLKQGAQGFGLPKERVLASFNTNASFSLLGVDSKTESALKNIVSDQATRPFLSGVQEIDPLLFDAVKHLIQASDVSDSYNWVFSYRHIQQRSIESLKSIIRDSILTSDSKTRVYHRDRWFLIPSEAYCYGFFEVGKLLARADSRAKLARWLHLNLNTLRPDVVIVVASNEGFATLLSEIKVTARKIIIDDPEKPASWPKLTLLEKGTKVAILIDVIGTGTTVRKVVEKLPEVEVSKILTIVDAREGGPKAEGLMRIEGKQYQIESVLRHPIKFEWDLPEGCTYEDIIPIDPISHAPSWPVEKKAPSWGDFDEFLYKVVKPTNSVAAGHFESDTKHILYFFLTPLIVNEFGSEITERIRRNIKLIYRQMRRAPQINTIVYPDKSPGADTVAEMLCSIPEFLNSALLPISTKVLVNPVSYPWSQSYEIRDAIIFDDAASSGSTIERMIDIVESWGAKRIFVYILFNRCDDFQTRILEKRKGHGKAKVEVRFLTHVKIPAYDSVNCPVCRTIKELEEAKEKVQKNEYITQFIENKLLQLKPQPISLLFKQSTQSIFLSLDIDRRIKRCKFRRTLETALTDPGARNELATIIRGKSTEDILLLFQVLAKEKHVFYPTNSKLNELFYPTFRRDLIKAARRIYLKPLEVTPKELDATITSLRIFDEDIFLADLDPLIDKTKDSDGHFSVVVMNLLTSIKVNRQPDLLVEVSTKYADNFNSEQLALFDDLVTTTRSDTATTPDMFIAALLAMHPSSGPSVQFEFLRYEVDSYLSREVEFFQLVPRLKKLWEELYRRITEDISPYLKRILLSFKTKKLNQIVLKQLEERMAEIDSYTHAARELYEVLIDEPDDDSTYELAEQFDTYVVGLQELLCSDEEDTLHTALLGMVAEIRRTVRSTLDMQKIKSILNKHDIDYEIIVPDEACYVFCNENDLVQAVANLLENLAHAFEDDASLVRKAWIEVESISNRIRLIIRDSGNATFPVRPKVGLQKVDSIVSSYGGKYIAPQPIEDAVYKTEVGFELVAISEEIIS